MTSTEYTFHISDTQEINDGKSIDSKEKHSLSILSILVSFWILIDIISDVKELKEASILSISYS